MRSTESDKVRVAVQATDPISQAGLVGHLRSCPEVEVVAPEQSADVVVLAPAALSAAVLSGMRRSAKTTGTPVVLVIDSIDRAELPTVVECRVMAIVPRAAATTERLLHSVLSAASGGGTMPPDMLGGLLEHVGRMQRDVLAPMGLNATGLSPREIDVLRLMSEGFDTSEIASKLCYSERTVKNVIYGITTRLHLRNRPHAVAYAMRAGVI